MFEAELIVSVADIARLWDLSWTMLSPSRAAQCAIDVALWDWFAKRNDTTVAELALGEKPRAISSFCTIGLSDPAELEKKIAELGENRFIKIKSDSRADLETLRRVHAQSAAQLAIDANCAWNPEQVSRLAPELQALGVIFLEQPFQPSENHAMPAVLAASPLPILADESCVTLDDVTAIPNHFSGFNIKLVKCGGLTPALRMLRRGRELGLRTMVGCMLESSVLIAAGAVIAQRTDYADLDGAWLLRDDPFRGWIFEHGELRPGAVSGLGVEPGIPLF